MNHKIKNITKIKGMTLLEVALSTAMLSVIIGVAFGFVNEMAYSAKNAIQHKDMQVTSNHVLQVITSELKESKPSFISVYDMQENGKWQTAVCFPTARTQNGVFMYFNDTNNNEVWDSGEEILEEPKWEGVSIFCLSYETTYKQGVQTTQGRLTKYTDYSVNIEVNGMPKITSITDTTITLSNGTTFNRNAITGITGNQTVIRYNNVEQMLRYPFDEANPNIVVFPISLNLTIQQEFIDKSSELIELENHSGVIARNRN